MNNILKQFFASKKKEEKSSAEYDFSRLILPTIITNSIPKDCNDSVSSFDTEDYLFLPSQEELRFIDPLDRIAFANDYATINAAKYSWITQIISKSKAPSIAIDDSQYLLVNELFDRAGEKGYDKFTGMAANFRNLIHGINEMEDDDKIVYFLHHSELDTDGREKVKTIGKMLDEKLTIEGCFDIVLYCQDHKFYTQANNQSTAKSPEDMFELEIPNDLKMVDTTIRKYYGMK